MYDERTVIHACFNKNHEKKFFFNVLHLHFNIHNILQFIFCDNQLQFFFENLDKNIIIKSMHVENILI